MMEAAYSPDDLDRIVREAREALCRDPHSMPRQLARALAEHALYAEAYRYFATAQRVRAGERLTEQLAARKRALVAVAEEYACATGWTPPPGWQPLTGPELAADS
jgi:hypothetical protein